MAKPQGEGVEQTCSALCGLWSAILNQPVTYKTDSPTCSTQTELWFLIRTVASADMRDNPPLQAAATLAYASNREFSAAEPFGYLAE
jgi:hypothetical protein